MRRGQLDAFNAKLAQYDSNPAVMVQREWGSAIRDFYWQDNVEVFMMYPGIGTLAIRGENGVLAVALGTFSRVTWNPFFPYLLGRVTEALPAP